MIVLDVKQGSEAWHRARLGIPTASQFDRILTAKTRRLSSASDRYLYSLVAARILGHEVEADAGSGFMLRGSALETAAISAYEFERDCDTKEVGFVLHDSRRWGCSPDRLVGDDGLLEIKCLAAANHFAALDGQRDDDHMSQCQGQMWVTGRLWVDLLFYNPDLPYTIHRIARDHEYIVDLAAAVEAFCDRLDKAEARLRVLMSAPDRAPASWRVVHADSPPAAAPMAGGPVSGQFEATVASLGIEPGPGPASEDPKAEFIAEGRALGWAVGTKGGVLAGWIRAIANHAKIQGLPGEFARFTDDHWRALRDAARKYRAERKPNGADVAKPLSAGAGEAAGKAPVAPGHKAVPASPPVAEGRFL